ncbi:MAG TPA: sugar ABC transporter permease, partial [Candidatus Atribacteria bacterium]|nr:sugar ABC transporter permease [Candidatus Atribacteria bacterium]
MRTKNYPLRLQEKIAGYSFLAPTVVVLAAVVAFPLIYSLIASFYAYTFVSPGFKIFLGLSNYINALKDSYFWNSLIVTISFVLAVVSIEFVLGFIIALMLNRDIRFKGVYYTILTIPMLLSPVAVGLIWKMLLHPDLGVMNYFLSLFGLKHVNWLGSPIGAFWSVLFVDIWQQISFMILLLLAGLVSLPKEP